MLVRTLLFDIWVAIMAIGVVGFWLAVLYERLMHMRKKVSAKKPSASARVSAAAHDAKQAARQAEILANTVERETNELEHKAYSYGEDIEHDAGKCGTCDIKRRKERERERIERMHLLVRDRTVQARRQTDDGEVIEVTTASGKVVARYEYEHPDPRISISGIKTSRLEMYGADLHGQTISDVKASVIDLRDANLRGAVLRNIVAATIDLRDADLRDAVLVDVRCTSLRLDGAQTAGMRQR